MKPWNPHQIEGVHRFLHKVWRELIAADGSVNAKVSAAPDAPEPAELVTALHATIKKVGEKIEALQFNTAISDLMVFANAMQKAPAISRDTVAAFLRMLAPFAPHIAEELWARTGFGPESVMTAPWPAFDPAKLAVTEVKLVFQVNGKHRGDQLVPVNITQDEALALAKASPKVIPHLEGKTIKRVIYVPGKILNIVVA
jgi:leucyl-tRNA synthetase